MLHFLFFARFPVTHCILVKRFVKISRTALTDLWHGHNFHAKLIKSIIMQNILVDLRFIL